MKTFARARAPGLALIIICRNVLKARGRLIYALFRGGNNFEVERIFYGLTMFLDLHIYFLRCNRNCHSSGAGEVSFCSYFAGACILCGD